MTAYPIGQVWGGLINWNAAQIPAALVAIENFSSKNNDPNAQVVVALKGVNGVTSISMLTFYDGPAPGPIYDEFLALPYDSRSLSTSSFLENVNTVSTVYTNAAHQRYTPLYCPLMNNA